MKTSSSVSSDHSTNGDYSDGLGLEENFLDSFHQELLAKGTELLKRNRKGTSFCFRFPVMKTEKLKTIPN